MTMKRIRHHARRKVLPIPTRRPSIAPIDSMLGQLAALARSGGRGLISIVLGAIMVALIGLLIANFIGQVMQSASLESSRVAIQAEVDHLRDEQHALKGAVDYAESNVNVERIAREQLGYARDGDIVILPQIIAPTPAPDPAPTLAPPAAPPQPSNAQRWWDAFFRTNAEATDSSPSGADAQQR